MLWRTVGIESYGLFDIFATSFNNISTSVWVAPPGCQYVEAKDLYLRAFAGGFANMGGSGFSELHETRGFERSAWMAEPKS